MKIKSIVICLILLLSFYSCKKNISLSEPYNIKSFSELGKYAKFPVFLDGDLEQMSSEIDNLIGEKIVTWKNLSKKEHSNFQKKIISAVKHQLNNSEWRVNKSATYLIEGFNKANDLVVQVNINKPVGNYNQNKLVQKLNIENKVVNIYAYTLKLPFHFIVKKSSKLIVEKRFNKKCVLEIEKARN